MQLERRHKIYTVHKILPFQNLNLQSTNNMCPSTISESSSNIQVFGQSGNKIDIFKFKISFIKLARKISELTSSSNTKQTHHNCNCVRWGVNKSHLTSSIGLHFFTIHIEKQCIGRVRVPGRVGGP